MPVRRNLAWLLTVSGDIVVFCEESGWLSLSKSLCYYYKDAPQTIAAICSIVRYRHKYCTRDMFWGFIGNKQKNYVVFSAI